MYDCIHSSTITSSCSLYINFDISNFLQTQQFQLTVITIFFVIVVLPKAARNPFGQPLCSFSTAPQVLESILVLLQINPQDFAGQHMQSATVWGAWILRETNSGRRGCIEECQEKYPYYCSPSVPLEGSALKIVVAVMLQLSISYCYKLLFLEISFTTKTFFFFSFLLCFFKAAEAG